MRHPSDVLKVGDRVNVWVLSVDKEKRRIALTMIDPAERENKKAEYEKQKQERAEKKAEWEKIKAERAAKHAEWEKRQKEREANKAEGRRDDRGERRDRRDDHHDRGERRGYNRDGGRREVGDYRDRQDREEIATGNTLEEKLAALAGRFNKK